MLKALFGLETFTFLFWLFGYVEKRLDKKPIFQIFMTSQTIQIFVIILESKDNQTMKLGQSREYNMKNIFPKKSYIKCGGEASPRLFYKISTLSISLDQQT